MLNVIYYMLNNMLNVINNCCAHFGTHFICSLSMLVYDLCMHPKNLLQSTFYHSIIQYKFIVLFFFFLCNNVLLVLFIFKDNLL